MKLASVIHKLKPDGDMEFAAVYSLPPRDSLICFKYQQQKNFNTWDYKFGPEDHPEIVETSHHNWSWTDHEGNVFMAKAKPNGYSFQEYIEAWAKQHGVIPERLDPKVEGMVPDMDIDFVRKEKL